MVHERCLYLRCMDRHFRQVPRRGAPKARLCRFLCVFLGRLFLFPPIQRASKSSLTRFCNMKKKKENMAPFGSSRELFYKTHNMMAPVKQSGGWSAHGQPVDQLHSQYRAKIRELDLKSCHMLEDLRKRPTYESMPLRASGQLERAVPAWMQIVELSLEAWKQLDRKVFKAAWVACGYFAWEDMPMEENEVPICLEDTRVVLDVFGKLGGTPQRCMCFEWQMKDDPWHVWKPIFYKLTWTWCSESELVGRAQDLDGTWKALPYEAAAALVRSLMLHLHKFKKAVLEVQRQKKADPSMSKPASQKAQEALHDLKDVQKFLVFNPRTGQMATDSWVNRYIVVEQGKPKYKKARKSGVGPRVLTLSVKIPDPAGEVKLALDLNDSSEAGPRAVRCFELAEGVERSGVEFYVDGFEHMAAPSLDGPVSDSEANDDDDDGEEEEDDSDSGLPADDQMGLEGRFTLCTT